MDCEHESFFMDHRCPVCGKNFIPAPFHLYVHNKVKLCSWTCMLKAERAAEELEEKRYATKPVLVFDIDGNYIGRYTSSKQAAKHQNVSDISVRKCCRGECKTVKGLIFKYATGEGD